MNDNAFVLCKKLGELCILRGVHIALAESCTGGMASAWITDVPGSSAWFNGSMVVYSNAAKNNLLDVDSELLKKYGAVSEPVALAMAKGALEKLHADLALSITGIAGPAGGTLEKPVGMVCFALADKKKQACVAQTQYFTGGRSHIRQRVSIFAVEWMIEELVGVGVGEKSHNQYL